MVETDIAPWNCRKCKRSLRFCDYYAEKGCTFGRRKTCIECATADMKVYRKAKGTEYFRQKKTETNYGLTPEAFDALFESQGRLCAICSADSPGAIGKSWHVDHDHSCCPTSGKSCGQCVRGVLCHGCNLILGHAKDDPDRLTNAIYYLAVNRGTYS